VTQIFSQTQHAIQHIICYALEQMLIKINSYKQIITVDIKVIVTTVNLMNFQGGAHYITMLVTRQLRLLLRQHICHFDLYTCTIYFTQMKYEGVSKIFRTGDAIYTAVVVARSTGRW
jgi:hypothetical protein